VIVERLPIEKAEKEGVPVVLRNRPAVRPFEIFTRVLPLPRYGTIDPTPLVAFFFPLFYGIIIGTSGTAFFSWRSPGSYDGDTEGIPS